MYLIELISIFILVLLSKRNHYRRFLKQLGKPLDDRMVKLDLRAISHKPRSSQHILSRLREIPQKEVSLAPSQIHLKIHFADFSLAVRCQCVFKGPILK